MHVSIQKPEGSEQLRVRKQCRKEICQDFGKGNG